MPKKHIEITPYVLVMMNGAKIKFFVRLLIMK